MSRVCFLLGRLLVSLIICWLIGLCLIVNIICSWLIWLCLNLIM